jgi:TonB family protein
VIVEAEVTDAGVVTGVRPIRITPPFTETVTTSVRQWRFSPAIQELNPDPDESQVIVKRPVKSKVLVAAMFRAPLLNNGPTLGTAPKDVAIPSDDIPFPTMTVMPLYPVRALFDGTVLVEVQVGIDGRVLDTKVLQSGAVFDGPAIDAVKQWVFRPARVRSVPSFSFAYVSFAFRQPITTK